MSSLSRRRLLLASAAGSVGAVAGYSASAASSISVAETPDATDVGFCSDMAAHHVQALAICQRVLGRDTGGAVQAAATEVLQNQAIEVGMMRAWLTDWGESTSTPDRVMGWMGAEDGAGVPIERMQGYASVEALTDLSLAAGLEQGRLFLELMREHHVGGVTMANHAAAVVATTKVRRLARTQAEVQTFEIAQYDQLIDGEYAIPGWTTPVSLEAAPYICELNY